MSKSYGVSYRFGVLVRKRPIATLTVFCILMAIYYFVSYNGSKQNIGVTNEAIQIPLAQQDLMKILRDAHAKYLQREGNEALEQTIRSDRHRSMCEFFSKNRKLENWHGYVSEIQADGSRSASLRVGISYDDKKFTALYFTQEGIEKGSPLFNRVLELKPKDPIIFSGDAFQSAMGDPFKRGREFPCDSFVYGVASNIKQIDIKFNFSKI